MRSHGSGYAGVGLVAFIQLTACGGGGGDGGPLAPPPGPTITYKVGGSVTGLSGSGLVLRDNGRDDLAVSANGSFTFATQFEAGAPYSVTIYSQPTAPAQTCAVHDASGTMGSLDVTAVSIVCTLSIASLEGTYQVTSYDAAGASGAVATLTFDGSGNLSGSQVQNIAGTISTAAVAGNYSLAVDGILTLSAVGSPALSGAISNDAVMFAVGEEPGSGQTPTIQIGVRQASGALTAGLLNDAYEFASLGNSGASGGRWTLNFNGAGSFSGSQLVNNAGAISTSSLFGTYAVAADGALTLTPSGAPPLNGWVGADGNTVIMGQLMPGQPPAMQLGIRAGHAGYTDATVAGVYKVATYGGSGEPWAILSLDGAGHYFGSSSGRSAGAYSVAADGILTLTPTAGSALTGRVAASGDTFIASQTTSGQSPSVLVGVQLSSEVAEPRAVSLFPGRMQFACHFGSVRVGCTPPQTAILQNHGTTRVFLLGIALNIASEPPFAVASHCPGSLGPGESCEISVTASFPRTLGTQHRWLRVFDSSGPTPHTVDLTVTSP